MKRALLLNTLACAVVATQACKSEQAGSGAFASGITKEEISQHIQNLAADSMLGRAPATPGGEKTEQYLAAQLKSYGVEPGFNGSYFQPVAIDVVKTDPASIRITTSGKATGSLKQVDEVAIWPGSASEASSAKGELVFIGYGADAPEYNWNDLKGQNLKGKILMVLVNDPPASDSEPNLFGGKAMTYYGRWTYKFEEAERQGAAGMFVIHNTEDAGYPWQVINNPGDQLLLPRDPAAPAPLGVRGWMQSDVAGKLFKQAGLDFEQLRAQAKTRDFKPVATGIMIDMSMKSSLQRMQANNVVGVVPGSDPALKDQYVLYSAHHDHLGVGAPVAGDSIYNGAEDNASGVADLLAIAHAAASAPTKPKRSQVFVFVTAEESGLLGSAFYGMNPTVPAAHIIAALNVDGGNVLGRVKDLTLLGETKSSLGPALAEMIKSDSMTISPDAFPEKGYFYRSDHFSFAKVGVPAVSIGNGQKYEGRPEGWGKQQDEEYTAKRYHQPSDQFDPKWDLSGAAQLADIVYRFGTLLANTDTLPTWNTDAEFKAIREKSLSGGATGAAASAAKGGAASGTPNGARGGR